MWFYKKSRIVCIQFYGKLPYANEFIVIKKTQEAIVWQEWLRNNRSLAPSDIHRFIFQNKKRSSYVIGLIKQSYDGMGRDFPFTVFVTWKKKWSRKKLIINDIEAIWNELLIIYDKYCSVDNISKLYSNHVELTIEVKPNMKENPDDIFNLLNLLERKKERRPLFKLIPCNKLLSLKTE